jgi:hypothetical protein
VSVPTACAAATVALTETGGDRPGDGLPTPVSMGMEALELGPNIRLQKPLVDAQLTLGRATRSATVPGCCRRSSVIPSKSIHIY